MGAVVLDGAIIGRGSIVGAGAVVAPGRIVAFGHTLVPSSSSTIPIITAESAIYLLGLILGFTQYVGAMRLLIVWLITLMHCKMVMNQCCHKLWRWCVNRADVPSSSSTIPIITAESAI